MLGIPFAAPTWWNLLISVCGYALPLILYAAWVSGGLGPGPPRGCLHRPAGRVAGRSAARAGGRPRRVLRRREVPIPAAFPWMLVAGGIGVYLVAAVAFLVAAG